MNVDLLKGSISQLWELASEMNLFFRKQKKRWLELEHKYNPYNYTCLIA